MHPPSEEYTANPRSAFAGNCGASSARGRSEGSPSGTASTAGGGAVPAIHRTYVGGDHSHRSAGLRCVQIPPCSWLTLDLQLPGSALILHIAATDIPQLTLAFGLCQQFLRLLFVWDLLHPTYLTLQGATKQGLDCCCTGHLFCLFCSLGYLTG